MKILPFCCAFYHFWWNFLNSGLGERGYSASILSKMYNVVEYPLAIKKKSRIFYLFVEKPELPFCTRLPYVENFWMELIEKKRERHPQWPSQQQTTHCNNDTGGGHEQQRTRTAAALGKEMLDSGVSYVLDAGAMIGAAGDLPGICGSTTSTGWQCMGWRLGALAAAHRGGYSPCALLESSQIGTNGQTYYHKFPLSRVSQQVGKSYLVTSDSQ